MAEIPTNPNDKMDKAFSDMRDVVKLQLGLSTGGVAIYIHAMFENDLRRSDVSASIQLNTSFAL